MVSILMGLSLVFTSPSTTSDYKVFVTNRRSEADLVVFKTKSKHLGKVTEWVWHETNSRYESDFTYTFVKSKYTSDLVVFFTTRRSESGWKKPHRLQNNLKVKK